MYLNLFSFPLFTNHDVGFVNYQEDRVGEEGMNLFFLPDFHESNVEDFNDSYDALLKKLKKQLLSVHRNSFSKEISEREWFATIFILQLLSLTLCCI